MLELYLVGVLISAGIIIAGSSDINNAEWCDIIKTIKTINQEQERLL